MKKLIIDLGLEYITTAELDCKGKNYKIIDIDKVPSGYCFSNGGSISVRRVVNRLKDRFGQDLKKADVEFILPNYMSNYAYRENGKKEKIPESKESCNGKLSDRIEVNVGDNGNMKMSQVLYFNKNVLNDFAREIYGFRLNMTSMVSDISAYQKSMPFFTDDEEGEGAQSSGIFIDVGFGRINCIIFDGYIPIYMKESGYSIFEVYQNIKERYENVTFGQFLQVFADTTPFDNYDRTSSPGSVLNISKSAEAQADADQRAYQQLLSDSFDDSIYDSDAGNDIYGSEDADFDFSEDNGKSKSKKGATSEQSEETYEEEDGIVSGSMKVSLSNLTKDIRMEISNEISGLLMEVCKEVRDVADYAHDQFSIQTLAIRSNSETMMRFVADQLSDVYDVFTRPDISEHFKIKGVNVDLSELQHRPVALTGCLGEISCGLTKWR